MIAGARLGVDAIADPGFLFPCTSTAPAKQPSQLNRREALQTVGATVALAPASGAIDLTGVAHAALVDATQGVYR
jgi:hypothetical protein